MSMRQTTLAITAFVAASEPCISASRPINPSCSCFRLWYVDDVTSGADLVTSLDSVMPVGVLMMVAMSVRMGSLSILGSTNGGIPRARPSRPGVSKVQGLGEERTQRETDLMSLA